MPTFAIAVLAVALAGPALSVAADRPTSCGPKTSSFVPRPRTNQHVYGAPISRPIVSHAKTSHPYHRLKKTPET